MKTLSDAQTLKRAFLGGKLKSLPYMPQNVRTWQRKKEVCSGNVVVHLGKRYRNGYRWKSAFVIVYTCVVLKLLDIRFYDDIRIYETTLESGEQMLKYFF